MTYEEFLPEFGSDFYILVNKQMVSFSWRFSSSDSVEKKQYLSGAKCITFKLCHVFKIFKIFLAC